MLIVGDLCTTYDFPLVVRSKEFVVVESMFYDFGAGLNVEILGALKKYSGLCFRTRDLGPYVHIQ